ncbi:hypothetical protein FB451DRAFT_1377387 [Mycena latifolia]|nr:hypothetical protein FB451DRAFT_1377387 [Mycena latifolia]
MGRLSKARITDQESAAQRLAEADDATRAAMTVSLAGTFHYKKLAQPTLESHNRTKKLWHLFVDSRPDKDTLPAEIVPGAQLPDYGVTKEFVRWLGYTLQGRLDKYVVKSTVKNYIFKYFALWRQYAFLPVPSAYRNHVLSYFHSAAFDETSPLSTKARVKETANIVDVEVLVQGVLADKRYFRTNRARYDTIYSCLISALSSERPGALVESGCYRGSNEAMTWDSHEYWVIPNPDNPHRPHPALILTMDWLKGHRDDEAANKKFFILKEPDSHRHVDALMYSFVKAFDDDIFEDVDTIEEVFFPKHPCTCAHKLRLKPSVLKQPVFRKEVYDHEGGKWVTSDTLAMPYNMLAGFLRKISLFLGFVLWFTFYCFRRCSANNMNAALPEDERVQMMGQTPGSDQFFKSYKSRLAVIDLGAILAGRLEENEENVQLMKAACGMSKNRDPNAPISLDAEEMNELLADEELVQFREEKAKLFAQLKREITELVRLITDEDKDAQRQVIRGIRTQIRDIDRKHGAIVTRETYALVKVKRAKYFEEASFRQLRGIGPTSRVPLAATRNLPPHPPQGQVPAPGKENRAPNASVDAHVHAPPDVHAHPHAHAHAPPDVHAHPHVHTHAPDVHAHHHAHVHAPPDVHAHPHAHAHAHAPAGTRSARVHRMAVSDPMDDAHAIIKNFTLENAGDAHFVASVNALLGLPDRPFKLCYPGESPTHDGRCPVCDKETTAANMNKGGGNVATHIHACIMKQLRENVQKDAEANYTAQACGWTTCGDKTVWATRAKFCQHLTRHIENLRFAMAQRGVASCMWEVGGKPCGEMGCEDLETHFAQVHGVNPSEKIDVKYCAICAESFIDFDGDGELWREHCLDHFAVLFLPFVLQVEAVVDFSEHGVIFTPSVDQRIQYENGSGLGGERPEFHGHLDHQVPLAPCFCPICVYDETLSMEVRMVQFCRNQDFQLHLSRHQNEILLNPEEMRLCAVPSCGTQSFNAHDYLVHLVVFHRVPICGSTNHTSIRRLRLPKVEEPMDVDVVDFAHLYDDVEQPSGSSVTAPTVAAATPSATAAPPAVKRKKRKYTAANPFVKVDRNHYCMSHRKQLRDIRSHIPSKCKAVQFKIRDPSLPRSQFGPVHNFAVWCASEEAGEYEPSDDEESDSDDDDAAAGPSKKPRVKQVYNYKCSGCSKEFPDIAKHLGAIRKSSSQCKRNRFKLAIKNAAATTPSTAPVAGPSSS